MSDRLTYQNSGVNITAGRQLVEGIKKHARSTYVPGVLGDIGFFGSFFLPDLSGYKQPVLVSSTDGVGTKLKIAIELGIHDTVGIDLVAMSVNDLVVGGAKPLYFLDYIACHKLEPAKMERIVAGIAEGCRQAGCALVGGETAEMNDLYKEGDYDLAGFVTGIVDRDKIIDGRSIQAGDILWALPSSGIHSNGYSLVRKVAQKAGWDTKAMAQDLLEPTRIYVKDCLTLINQVPVKGLAHITGGGLPEKAGRIIPDGLQAQFDSKAWIVPDIFQKLQRDGGIEQAEMFRAFNMGLGLVAALPPDIVSQSKEWIRVGIVKPTDGRVRVKIV